MASEDFDRGDPQASVGVYRRRRLESSRGECCPQSISTIPPSKSSFSPLLSPSPSGPESLRDLLRSILSRVIENGDTLGELNSIITCRMVLTAHKTPFKPGCVNSGGGDR